VGHAGHSQIHTDLSALALEVLAQALDDLLIHALGYAHHVLRGPGAVSGLLFELRRGSAAHGALGRGGIALMNITTDGANKLFHGKFLLIIKNLIGIIDSRLIGIVLIKLISTIPQPGGFVKGKNVNFCGENGKE